jgi:hypothetical protein
MDVAENDVLDSMDNCTVCPAGTYLEDNTEGGDASLHDSPDDCTECAAGKALGSDETSALAHDGPNDCINCGAGKSAATTGSTLCEECVEGKVGATERLPSSKKLTALPSVLASARDVIVHRLRRGLSRE